jgi:hypothetical protein
MLAWLWLWVGWAKEGERAGRVAVNTVLVLALAERVISFSCVLNEAPLLPALQVPSGTRQIYNMFGTSFAISEVNKGVASSK